MFKSKFILVYLINIIIATAFFVSNTKSSINNISSDLANIIPICKKIDNPELYLNDMYLYDIKNVEYYTPFFVHTLRFVSFFCDSNYLIATNVLSFIIHVIYGLIWFFFFYSLKKDFWIALIFSIFMRGIIWPPGMEILGISDLWTIMPRTLYAALLPLPFIIYLYFKKWNIIFASFLLGLIFNFHPISGIGGIVIYFSIFIINIFFERSYFNFRFFINFLYALIFCLIGMIPFLLTYFFNIENNITVDPVIFEQAFLKRIPKEFLDPILYASTWHRPVTYVFGFCFLVYYFFDSSLKKRNFKLILAAVLFLFISANAFFYVERFLNEMFHMHIRMSFQLLRYQKFIIVLFQISIFLLFVEISNILNIKNSIKRLGFLIFIGMLFVSKLTLFNSLPILGDDMIRGILPMNITQFKKKNNDFSNMMCYIKSNTDKEAVFYGKASFYIRSGADRSVVLDGKGAGMLIEGNPLKFVQWYKDVTFLNTCDSKSKIQFLKSKKVNYILDIKPIDNVNLINKIGNYYLYKIQ